MKHNEYGDVANIVGMVSSVLAKKIAGKSHDEIKTIYSEMNDKIIKEVLEFNDVYAYMLAMGAAASREKKGGDQ